MEISLSTLLSRGPLILYFYPADFTPVCTKEACMVRNTYDELQAAGITIAGVSPNDEETHRRFKKKHSLEHTLLADVKKHVIRLFGVNGPLGISVRRATFLIDPSRQILNALCADFRLSRHSDFLRKTIITPSTENISNREQL